MKSSPPRPPSNPSASQSESNLPPPSASKSNRLRAPRSRPIARYPQSTPSSSPPPMDSSAQIRSRPPQPPLISGPPQSYSMHIDPQRQYAPIGSTGGRPSQANPLQRQPQPPSSSTSRYWETVLGEPASYGGLAHAAPAHAPSLSPPTTPSPSYAAQQTGYGGQPVPYEGPYDDSDSRDVRRQRSHGPSGRTPCPHCHGMFARYDFYSAQKEPSSLVLR